MIFRTLNAARSAFVTAKFAPSFFDAYEASTEPARCKVFLKVLRLVVYDYYIIVTFFFSRSSLYSRTQPVCNLIKYVSTPILRPLKSIFHVEMVRTRYIYYWTALIFEYLRFLESAWKPILTRIQAHSLQAWNSKFKYLWISKQRLFELSVRLLLGVSKRFQLVYEACDVLQASKFVGSTLPPAILSVKTLSLFETWL